MPLDPDKLAQKTPKLRAEVLLAAEWAAIVFAGMLAVLFLAWALALQLPETGMFMADESSQTMSDSASLPQ